MKINYKKLALAGFICLSIHSSIIPAYQSATIPQMTHLKIVSSDNIKTSIENCSELNSINAFDIQLYQNGTINTNPIINNNAIGTTPKGKAPYRVYTYSNNDLNNPTSTLTLTGTNHYSFSTYRQQPITAQAPISEIKVISSDKKEASCDDSKLPYLNNPKGFNANILGDGNVSFWVNHPNKSTYIETTTFNGMPPYTINTYRKNTTTPTSTYIIQNTSTQLQYTFKSFEPISTNVNPKILPLTGLEVVSSDKQNTYFDNFENLNNTNGFTADILGDGYIHFYVPKGFDLTPIALNGKYPYTIYTYANNNPTTPTSTYTVTNAPTRLQYTFIKPTSTNNSINMNGLPITNITLLTSSNQEYPVLSTNIPSGKLTLIVSPYNNGVAGNYGIALTTNPTTILQYFNISNGTPLTVVVNGIQTNVKLYLRGTFNFTINP